MSALAAAGTTRSAVRVAGWLTLAGSLAPLVLGLWFVAEDARQRGEMFDGLGLFVGLCVLGIGAVPVVVGGVALRLRRERPRHAAWLLAVFGVLVALVGWPATGAVGLAVGAAMVLGGLLVAAIAFLGLVVAPYDGGGRSRDA